MALRWTEIQYRAKQFSKVWKNSKDERKDAQSWENAFFDVFGVSRKTVATFEERDGMNGFIDLLWPGRLIIEMKSSGKDLSRAFEQARDYAQTIKEEKRPDWIMVSDFDNIRLYEMLPGINSQSPTYAFKTSQLAEHVRKFHFLVEEFDHHIELKDDTTLNTQASYKMAALHDILKDNHYCGHALEVFLVRLLFCLFAEDAGIFEPDQFTNYIKQSNIDGSDLSARLSDLFYTLRTPIERRQDGLSDELKSFRYVNGGLFEERLDPAMFNIKMRKILLDCTDFNWRQISPAIFGAMFQGVMNPEERRELGAHYTSEENILKVIKPLFLDELYAEFESSKVKKEYLERFHQKLTSLTFLDPACGCGNFLIITYKKIRELELEVLRQLDNQIQTTGQTTITGADWASQIKVNVSQFYGIECEEFPCEIAKVGMWLMDHLMNDLAADYSAQPFDRIPIKYTATIIHDNALTIDWNTVVPIDELCYIFGNPPFVGASIMDTKQKAEAVSVFGNIHLSNSIDYVGAWYHKTAAYIQNTKIRAAFVSTNSITQGEQVAPLWDKILNLYNVHIDFAYRTFKWSNEAKGKAAVHCVIIGLSQNQNTFKKLYLEDNTVLKVNNISPYLIAAPNILVKSRATPICNVPPISLGNKPSDGGNLILNEEEKNELLRTEPQSAEFIRNYIGSVEFINGLKRYCIWLANANPTKLKQCPSILNRIEKVRQFRLQSTAAPTREKAETPQLFFFVSHPDTEYLLIPSVSSEKRKYIPIGYIDKNTIASNAVLIVPNATLYHFGVLTSDVHMAWMRVVAGRLKSDYRYAASTVYNTFPWPNTTNEQKETIAQAAQNILNVRDFYEDNSLSDLYDPLTMPSDLLKAHRELDKAVLRAYDAHWKSDMDYVPNLLTRYQILADARE